MCSARVRPAPTPCRINRDNDASPHAELYLSGAGAARVSPRGGGEHGPDFLSGAGRRQPGPRGGQGAELERWIRRLVAEHLQVFIDIGDLEPAREHTQRRGAPRRLPSGQDPGGSTGR
jgi:hypothetical protein